jgi:hypothetical protein
MRYFLVASHGLNWFFLLFVFITPVLVVPFPVLAVFAIRVELAIQVLALFAFTARAYHLVQLATFYLAARAALFAIPRIAQRATQFLAIISIKALDMMESVP